MPHDRSEVHLAADFSAQPMRALEEGTFRVAIVGDFSGRSGSPAGAAGQRRALRVDRDDIEKVLSRIAPSLRVELDPNDAPVTISFSSLDDFHPDGLAERVPIFQRLFALRNEASSAPAPRPAPPPRRAQQADAVAVDLAGGSLLDQIVGGAPADSPAATRQAAPPDDLADFVSRAVRSHMVGEAAPEQRELIAKVNEVIAATMRVLLHHPRFQALESLWRGVDFLVRRLDTSDAMQVFLVDVSREELEADLTAPDVARTSLHRVLVDDAGRQGEPIWSVIAAAYTFEPKDAAVLASLATLGRMAGAPCIAAAHPRFVGVDALAGSDSDDWTPHRSSAWDAVRALPAAAFLSLATPRFLVRLPYGKRGEECDVLRFEELGDGPPQHDSFLWGNPAVLCALAVADNVTNGDSATSRATIGNLPLYVAPVDGEPTAIPCAEVLMTQRAAEDLLDAGLTVLVSPRDGDEIIIPRVQSVAAPLRPLAIRSPS